MRAFSIPQPWGLALHNLMQDKLRLALSVVGIALSVMLILFLLGFRAGLFESVQAFLDNSPGSVVVLPKGAKNSVTGSGQYVPSATADAVAGQPGVAWVTPILQARAMPELHGREEAIILIGYDPALGGGSWDLSEGRAPAADDEVVLDRVLANRHSIAVGQSFELGGRTLSTAPQS